MPFGTFMAQTRESRTKNDPAAKLVPTKGKSTEFHDSNSDSQKLHVLLWGRSASAMVDFLCAMSENTNQELHWDGLTCYTTELETIRCIVSRKKKLERFLAEFNTGDWCCPEEQESTAVYTFSISPSGIQNKRLDLVFHCCVYGSESSLPDEQADAVWYLADGPVLDPGIGYDSYREFLKDELSNLHPAEDGSAKPVCLLLSQIEKQGIFGGTGEQCFLKPSVYGKLINRCRELFFCNEGVKVALLPVQIYGGLEYAATDANGDPVLRLAENSFCQSYVPEDCQIAGMYTVEQIARLRDTDFFAGSACGGMKKAIRRQFARKKGDFAWMPDMLREVREQ